MANSLTLQAVLQQFLPHYQLTHSLSLDQERTCSQLLACRTAALGGQQVSCSQCDFSQVRYHSCRNRHCPLCQQHATAEWANRQLGNLLDVNYFHLVFTLPHTLNRWIEHQPDLFYRLLFRCAWQTIRQFGADPKRLNGQMGMTAALHTWGQNLSRHVHLHCLIPGGALASDNRHFFSAKGNYLFPVRALSRCFRGKFVSELGLAIQQKTVMLPQQLSDELTTLMDKEWVVYAKHTLDRAKSVVNYLSRYTYKTAISHSRLVNVDEHSVSFRWMDYRDQQKKVMNLSGEAFLQRFLWHVLPRGFMRIRHYGFLANRCRKQKLSIIRQAIASSTNVIKQTTANGHKQHTHDVCCPRCGKGTLKSRWEVFPVRYQYAKYT